MAFDVPIGKHFEGGANITKGSRKSQDDATLAEYLRKFKAGSVTASGAGDQVVTFDEPYDDADYHPVLGPGSVSGGTVKDGTIAAAGFTIVAGGAGIIPWMSLHD